MYVEKYVRDLDQISESDYPSMNVFSPISCTLWNALFLGVIMYTPCIHIDLDRAQLFGSTIRSQVVRHENSESLQDDTPSVNFNSKETCNETEDLDILPCYNSALPNSYYLEQPKNQSNKSKAQSGGKKQIDSDVEMQKSSKLTPTMSQGFSVSYNACTHNSYMHTV